MSAVDQAREVPWQPRHNPWAIAIVVTLAAFMEILDTTIVNVALPHIAGSLSTSNDEASWALTSYLVANGIVLTISGWLSAVIGRKRYFLICLSMFTVCSHPVLQLACCTNASYDRDPGRQTSSGPADICSAPTEAGHIYGRPRPVRVFSVLLLLGCLQASIRSFRP